MNRAIFASSTLTCYHRLRIFSCVTPKLVDVCHPFRADSLGRIILAPREMPSGLVTALIGAPYFLWLLYRNQK
ncbi:iron chelate uptake ABC transporter family permease subunit [Coleofasciculus sp.]|uniref:iron chelate uptake ABC transporter family permease subunit n=1 Tax=Coleofasciculus sp. TaxID=3100458 RepID=UPI0039F89ED9